MIPILAKTEWPSLGELVWEYLTTDEAIIYTPGVAMCAIVIFCIAIEWLLVQRLSPLLPDERLLVVIIRTNAFVKMPITFFLISQYVSGTNLLDSPPVIFVLSSLAMIIESFVYCSEGNVPFSFSMFIFMFLSIGLAIVGYALVFSYGFVSILLVILGAIGFIGLIAQDKLAAAECSWILLCIFMELTEGD